jgi:hypothetical protein
LNTSAALRVGCLRGGGTDIRKLSTRIPDVGDAPT